MPISNIIRTIQASDPTQNAAKVPEWHGYVYKTTTGLTEAEIAAGKYKLIYVKANGDQYVFQWDGSGYTKQIREMKCSTGMKGHATPQGTFQGDGKVTANQWYYFRDYNCYAKYAWRIIGGIMFHSVLYNSSKQGPTNSSVNALGRTASHGCIRLAVNDAEWIFNNCPPGTTVVIR